MALEPLADADTVADPAVATVPAVAVKVAVVVPEGRVIEEGTVSAGLLLVNVTACPPERAAFVKVTVQVLVPPEVRLAGEQDRPEIRGNAVNPSVNVAEVEFAVAVSVAAPSLVKEEMVAVKDAVAAPAATMTDAGTVTVD